MMGSGVGYTLSDSRPDSVSPSPRIFELALREARQNKRPGAIHARLCPTIAAMMFSGWSAFSRFGSGLRSDMHFDR
jgi:hypothetical protein